MASTARSLALSLVFFSTALIVAAEPPAAAPEARAALVIGNSAYKASPLANPANDAADIAASLKEAGFEVILRTDQDLAGMEGALTDFQASLKGKDTALFYYAGHGVQVEGENYLVPVNEDIQSSAQAKSRSVSLGEVLERIKASGAKTALVFLDACRDNPFPGASRGGSRGLAVVSAPPELETCIAYATQPGNTAQDGAGRNGVFTAALLKGLCASGASLSDLMTAVIADVKAATGSKQQPRFDNGLSRPFYFVEPAVAAGRAQAALEKSKSELAVLDAKLSSLQAQIAKAGDAQARQKLQVEEQRQKALQEAKALEAENLAKEAAKRKAAADEAARAAAERAAAQAASAKAQDELSTLAAARRAELDKLALAAASDNPDILIDTVERLEAALKEIDGQYAAALQKSLDACNVGWDKQLAALSGQQPDITETDDEFAARIAKERTDLQGRRQAELASLRQGAEAQRLSQTASMRAQHDETLRTLQTKVWTVAGSAATLSIGAFDRNARTWPFTVDSADPSLPMLPVSLVAQLGRAADPKAAILALDAAVKAKALAAEIDWGIARDAANKRYAIDIRAARVRNLTTNEVVAEARPDQRAAYFQAGKRATAVAVFGIITVSGDPKDGPGDAYIDGVKVGSLPYSAKLDGGSVSVEVRWDDPNAKRFLLAATIRPGETTAIQAVKPDWVIGEIGPAGGIIFFDKGKASDGWRYLEAAPNDLNFRIQWSNGSDIAIDTDIAVGTGKANTDAIIVAQREGDYAALACRKLNVNGFTDWFLPSKGELDLMYTNLHKIGLDRLVGGVLWSSSQYMNNDAWVQNFSDGLRASDHKYYMHVVRACRAF